MYGILHKRKKRLKSHGFLFKPVKMVIRREEKRCFPRIEFRAPLRYQVRGRPESKNTLIENISAGGLSFLSETFMPRETRLMLEFGVLSRVLRPIGRIAWTSPVGHSDQNRLGVEFIELESQERNYLQDYVKLRRDEL